MKSNTLIILILFSEICLANLVINQVSGGMFGKITWYININVGNQNNDKDMDCLKYHNQENLGEWKINLAYPCSSEDEISKWLSKNKDQKYNEIIQGIKKSNDLSQYLYQENFKLDLTIVLFSENSVFEKKFKKSLKQNIPIIISAQVDMPESLFISGLFETIHHELNHLYFKKFYKKIRLDDKSEEAIAEILGICGATNQGNTGLSSISKPDFKIYFQDGKTPEQAFEESEFGQAMLAVYGKKSRYIKHALGYVHGVYKIWEIFGTNLKADDPETKNNLFKFCKALVNEMPRLKGFAMLDYLRYDNFDFKQ